MEQNTNYNEHFTIINHSYVAQKKNMLPSLLYLVYNTTFYDKV